MFRRHTGAPMAATLPNEDLVRVASTAQPPLCSPARGLLLISM
jgi:hypothetical protein